MSCKHGKYQWKGDLVHLHNEKLAINQPVLKLRLFCRLCQAPCYFRGEESFSLERPSVGAEHVVVQLPFCYPEVISDEVVAVPSEDEDDDNKPHTIH